MLHYTKSFGTFARAYGMQEGSGLSELYEGVIPVSVVDQTTEYVQPTYPQYTLQLNRAAVAAVYSLCGIFCPPNGNPIRLLGLWGSGAVSMFWSLGIANRITANAGTGTPAGLVRSGLAATTQGHTGTTTVSPSTLDSSVFFAVGSGPWATPLRGLVLRPGEWLFTATSAVAAAALGYWYFEELLFPLGANPTAL